MKPRRGRLPLKQHRKVLQIINKTANEKPSIKGKFKGSSSELRIQLWFDHLKKLLGTPAPAPQTAQIIQQIYT